VTTADSVRAHTECSSPYLAGYAVQVSVPVARGAPASHFQRRVYAMCASGTDAVCSILGRHNTLAHQYPYARQGVQ
jgi:hypothetical protein